MRNRRDGHSMPDFIAHPVRSRADWERYRDERLQPCLEHRLARLPDFVRSAAATDAAIQVGAFPWGVFGTARDLLGAEELLLGFHTDPDLVKEIMEACVTLWLALYERVAQAVHIDHIHIWEDMSGRQGSLISMPMVEEFLMPHYDRLAEFARRHAVPVVSVDSDGRVDELLAVMTRHGVNAFMPFEVQAGNRVEEVRERYPDLAIFGGLDKNALAADKAAMHRELERAEHMLARGRYIVGFDHLLPPNVPWTNFVYVIEHLRRLLGR
jgi:uroporphyrinogen decarboxylase